VHELRLWFLHFDDGSINLSALLSGHSLDPLLRLYLLHRLHGWYLQYNRSRLMHRLLGWIVQWCECRLLYSMFGWIL